MSDPFDVSLRVKLDYQGAQGAKSAVADIEAVRRAATHLGTPAAGALAKELAAISAQAQDAQRVIAHIADTAKRQLADTRIAEAAKDSAKTAVEAFNREFTRANPGRMFGGVVEGAAQARRGISELGHSVEALSAASGPRVVQRELGAVRDAATAAKTELQQARREAEKLGTATGGSGHGSGGPPGGGGGAHGGGAFRQFERGAAMPFRMERVAALATSVGGAVGLGGGYALYEIQRGLSAVTGKAIDFESAMVNVRQAAGNLPDDGVKQLGNSILAVSRSTGAATADLASLTAAAARAGRPIAEIPAFLERSAKAARVMGMGVDETGQKLIQLGRSWHQNEAGIEDTTDAVAIASQRTGARAGGVLDFVNNASGMRARGMSARQAAALGAGFQASGLDPSQSISAFNGLAERLAAPQRAGQEFQLRLHALGPGFSPEQLHSGMRTDPTRTIMDFLGAIRKLPENGRGNVLAGMFGPEQGEQIARVVEHLDDFKRTLGIVEDEGARSHALERAFSIFDETTRAKIEKATAALEGFEARLGKIFAPAVGAAADNLANALNTFILRWERLDKVSEITGKLRRGEALSDADKSDIAADPKLKASVDDYQAGQDRWKAQGYHAPAVPPQPHPAASEPPNPEAAAARDRNLRRELDRLRGLEQQKAIGAGGPQIDAEIFDARRRIQRTFGPGALLGPDAPNEGTAVPQGGLLHHTAFHPNDDEDNSSGGLQAIIAAGTKVGVIAGFREMLDMRSMQAGAAGSGLIRASYATSDRGQDEISGSGGGEGSLDDGIYRGDGSRAGSGHAGGGRTRGSALGRPGSAQPSAISSGPSTKLGHTGAKFAGKAPAIMRGLMDRYGLTREQAAGVVGNLGHESAGFTAYHEGGQAPSKGGVGWAQWTGSRRRDFENWTAARGLDPTSDQASWRYLTEGDPETAKAIEAVKKTSNAHNAAAAFERSFERAGVKAYGSRFNYADRALRLGPAQSPRFAEPENALPRSGSGASEESGASPGRAKQAAGVSTVQNFYGMHDPAQTARFAMLEQNREVRRAQARALHSVGRIA